MNQYAKEIKEELDKICAKYSIKKGLLLLVENKADNKKVIRHRVIVFNQEGKSELDIHEYAELLNGCILISKTFQKIIEHMNFHAIKSVVKNISIMEILRGKGKKGVMN